MAQMSVKANKYTEHMAQMSGHYVISFRQQDDRMKRSESESTRDWNSYREDKPHGSSKVEEYLEEMKARLVDRDCDEIVVGFETST